MADALRNAGLVSEDQFDKNQARKMELGQSKQGKHNHDLLSKSHMPVTYDALLAAGSPRAFRHAALQILLVDPDAIGQVIEHAQRFKEADGGKKLIWQMHQVKELAPTVKDECYTPLLKRGLRQSGGTFDIPAEWRR